MNGPRLPPAWGGCQWGSRMDGKDHKRLGGEELARTPTRAIFLKEDAIVVALGDQRVCFSSLILVGDGEV